jgi:hypothetical protein
MTSQINPNNIDGSYPVAGQDNNSQGFRDNFTNIKINFQDASDEITDLQNKVIVKSALNTSGAPPLDNNMADTLIYAAQIRDFSGTKVALAATDGSVTVNYTQGHYQSVSTTGNLNLTFSNFPPASQYGYMKIQFNITNVAHTVTFSGATFLGTGGIQGYNSGTNTVSFTSTGYYEFGFGSYDNGSTITIFDLNRALTNFSGADVNIDDLSATGFVSAVGNVTGGNLRSAGTISASGNVVGGNLTTSAQVVATGNVSGGNIVTAGAVLATGNVTGGNLIGYVTPTAGVASKAPITLTAGTNITVPTGGAFEYDGIVFYTTPQTTEQRGVAPSVHFLALAADWTGNDSSAAQKVFNQGTGGAGAITLSDSTTYEFEGVYYITRSLGTNSHTTATVFAVSSALTSITYYVDATTSTGAALTPVSRIYSTAPTATVCTAASISATENLVISVKGILRTNASTTVTPQIQFSSAPGGAPTFVKNSYIKFTPLGTSAVTTVGNW